MADQNRREAEDTKRAARAAARAVLAKHPCVVAGAATSKVGEAQVSAPQPAAGGNQPLKV